MQKMMITILVIAVLLIALLRLFASGVMITISTAPNVTATFTYEQQVHATFDAMRTELNKINQLSR